MEDGGVSKFKNLTHRSIFFTRMVRALSAIDLWSLCYAKNGPDGRSLHPHPQATTQMGYYDTPLFFLLTMAPGANDY